MALRDHGGLVGGTGVIGTGLAAAFGRIVEPGPES